MKTKLFCVLFVCVIFNVKSKIHNFLNKKNLRQKKPVFMFFIFLFFKDSFVFKTRDFKI